MLSWLCAFDSPCFLFLPPHHFVFITHLLWGRKTQNHLSDVIGNIISYVFHFKIIDKSALKTECYVENCQRFEY